MHTRICTSRRMWAAASVVLAAAVSACESPSGTNAKGPPGITLVSGAGVTDTISSVLSAPLVVDVRDADGRPLREVEVVFQSREIAFSLTEGDTRASYVHSVLTDRDGRASMWVTMGFAAGPGRAVITVPTHFLADTAEYTIMPGAPFRLDVAPKDTAVNVGVSYPLRIVATDRTGNPVQAPTINFGPGNSGITWAGTMVQAVTPGRGHLQLRVGNLTTEAFVSVVPPGTLTAMLTDGAYQFSTDGSSMRRVVTTAYSGWFRWYSDGQKFVFTEGSSERLRFSLPGGGTRIISTGPSMISAAAAHWSRDGEWVYFGGHFATDARPYRVRPDGTGLQMLPGYVHDGSVSTHPSPSPDETRVVYSRVSAGMATNLWIQSLESGAVIASGIPGHGPEWSHGEQIAFVAPLPRSDLGPISVMNSNGTGARVIAPDPGYDRGMDWSRDDRWIVARNRLANRLELVEVATGTVLPLPYSTDMKHPTWKP